MGHAYLTDIAEGLKNRFRFVFYDQRGAGLSYARSKDGITMPKNVEDLETLRKTLGSERVNLVSHSAGTYLAMEYLRTHPGRVKNLVLLGATDPKNGDRKFFTDSEWDAYKRQREDADRFFSRPEVQAEIRRAGLDKRDLTVKEAFLLDRIRSAAGTIYNMSRWPRYRFLYPNRDAALGARVGMDFTYDWSGILAAHPFPVTVINGVHDYQVGLKGSPIWKRVAKTEARNVELVLIEKASHNSWIDEPAIFRRHLLRALTKEVSKPLGGVGYETGIRN